MVPRSLKLAAGGSFLAGLVFYGAVTAGRAWGRSDVRGEVAVAAAAAERAARDSVLRDVRRRDSLEQLAADSAKRAENARIRRARANTDAAIAETTEQLAAARKTLEDEHATVEQLRGALGTMTAAVDTLAARLAAERASTDSALKAKDAAHERQVGALRRGQEETAAANARAYQSLQDGIAAQVRAAEKRGVNVGRMQVVGAIGAAGLLALATAIAK